MTRQILLLRTAQRFDVSKKPDETNDDPDLVAKKQCFEDGQHNEHQRRHITHDTLWFNSCPYY